MQQESHMRKHNVRLIVNPNADLGRAWKGASYLRPIVEELGGADWTGTVYPTHATELTIQAAEAGYETVIAAGGDGTVHEVVNGLMQVPPENRPKLGIIPLGSGNDFSHLVGINKDPVQAARQAMAGKPLKVDIGVLSDARGRTEYWDNAIGIGFDTTVTIRSRRVPVVRGFLIYLIAVMQTIIFNHDAPCLKVDTDTESFQKDILMLVLCNGRREGGGFMVAPKAQPSDGKFDYVYVEKVSRPMMLRLLPEVMKGTHERFKQVTMGEFRKVKVESDRPLYIHTDGEIFAGFGVDVRQLSAEIIPGAIDVKV
jgi:diacylglycerol kinase (ATP)